MSANIKAYVSRYVVPFYYKTEDRGYDRIITYLDSNVMNGNHSSFPEDAKWVRAGFWENYKDSKEKQAEMDLYSFLPSIYQTSTVKSDEDIGKIGASYVYYKKDGKLFEAQYKKKDLSVTFHCSDIGVLLFKDGVGFLWYEVGFGNSKKYKPDIDLYIEFQHDFKELARTDRDYFVRKKGYDKEREESLFEPLCFGKWISDLLSVNETGIRFWAERVSSVETERLSMPDKALLFNYVFSDPIEEGIKDSSIFRITNGYDTSYNPPESIRDNLYQPFGNMQFYMSKAGMSCMVSDDTTNEEFFKGQFREKFIRDYFYIYILLLYQSFSCAHFSWLLTNLPAEETQFEKSSKYRELLETLNERINLFLVKSVFESVSNIHHQNDFYRYGKGVLCIDDDIQSLTIGLDALKEIEGDKRDRKINNALAVFGFMVVISALIDGVAFVDWVTARIRPQIAGYINIGHISVCLFIILLAIYLVVVLLKDKKK